MRAFRFGLIMALLFWAMSAFAGGLDIQQGSTSVKINFLLISSTDHISPLTGATATVTISKNGGAFAASAGTTTEIGSGWYSYAPTSTETNTVGDFILHATATGADPADRIAQVVAYNPGSSTNLGLSGLPTANPNASGGLVTNGTGAGQISLSTGFVTLTALEHQEISADDQDALRNAPYSSVFAWNSIYGVTGLSNAGTAQGGTATTIQLAATASASQGAYQGWLVYIAGGTDANQVRCITSYTGTGSSPNYQATIDHAWPVAPDSTSQYILIPRDAAALNASLQVTSASVVAGVNTTQWGGVNVGGMPNSGNVTVGGYASGQDPATFVLGATASAWNTTGTIGHDINAAGTASDPWQTALPGAYGAGTAGNLLGNLIGNLFSTALPGPYGNGTAGKEIASAGAAGDPWATLTSNETTAGSFGKLLGSLQLDGSNYIKSDVYSLANSGVAFPAVVPAVAAIATGIWQDLATGSDFTTTNSVGALIAADINATISSRQSGSSPVQLPATAPAGFLSSTDLGNIASTLLTSTVDGTLTVKQALALTEALSNGAFTVTRSSASPWTITVAYFRADGVTQIASQVTTYSDSTFSKAVSRAKPTFSNLP